MKQLIKLNLNLDKIDKSLIYTSPKTKAKYLNLTVLLREEPDQYGNDGFVVQDVSKEQKEAGNKGPILGNAKIKVFDNQVKQALEDDDIPF
jgi:hypothetical protein